MTLPQLNRRLDEALDRRVRLHRDREAGKIGVKTYLDGLREVRALEDELEPQRRQLGRRFSRAFERCTVRSDGYERVIAHR